MQDIFPPADIISADRAADIRARCAQRDAWIDTIRDKRSGWASYRPEDVPPDVPQVSNEDRSELERFDFCANPPDRYFAYVAHRADNPPRAGYTPLGVNVTTWTGGLLGLAYLWPEYRSNFGDRRRRISVRAINGRRYHGTYYFDAGDYCRLRAVKDSHRGG